MDTEETTEAEDLDTSESTEDSADEITESAVAVLEEETQQAEGESEQTPEVASAVVAEVEEISDAVPAIEGAAEDSSEAEASVVEEESATVENLVEESDSEQELALEPAPATGKLAWWPFVTYALLWVALAIATYFVLRGPEADIPAFRQEAYPYVLLGGLVMTLLGPLLAVLLWFLARQKAGVGNREGLFTKAMIRGSVVTFLGVAAWYGALNLVDVMRLGWI